MRTHRNTARHDPDAAIYEALTAAGKSLEKLIGAPCSALLMVRNDVTGDLYFVTNIEDAGDLIEQFTDGESKQFSPLDTRDCMLTAGESDAARRAAFGDAYAANRQD